MFFKAEVVPDSETKSIERSFIRSKGNIIYSPL
jgi:hypothetical protein